MGTSRTVVHYASGDNRDYEFEWSKAVLEYLEKGYPAEEKNCELEVGSTTYKVLKRDTVTAFYDADGNTLFDVTNDRLKEEYEAMESLDETEPKSEIGRAIAGIEKQAFDEAVYMGKTSLADIVTGNVPDPTPEEVQKAMEEQAGAEEAEGDEPGDDSCGQDIEETHDTETQEASENGGEEEKTDPEPTAKGIDGAVAKLQGELKKAKEGYAEPILSHMIDRCKESETLADAVCPVPVIKHLTLSTNYRIQRIRHLQIPQKKHRKPQKQWKRRRRQPITGRMQLAIMIRAVWKRFIQQKNL